ncbi:MAG TPA: glycoside hydrolase domain-containing protein [Chthonomonadales bacterium]|nr:glycoside hydrolase domain-containing protein [Chthonomonadales bacterium]
MLTAIIALAAAAAAPQAAAPQAAAAPVEAWAASALSSVFRDATLPAAASALDLRGARAQTLGGQVVLRASAPVRVTGVKLTGLRGPRALRPSFWWAFVDHYHVEKNSTHTPPEELLAKAPADIPDAFSEETERDVPAGVAQPIWVQVRVPERAPAGVYEGEIEVATSGGSVRVPVRLTVYDYAFPKRPRLWVTIWTNTASLAKHHGVEEGSEAYWRVVERMADLMREHHQNVILTSWASVKAKRDAAGGVTYDFAAFDRWVETFLARGLERIEISHVGGREHGQWEAPNFVEFQLEGRDAEGKPILLPIEQWLPALQEHLRRKGWLERSMIHVADEPIPVNVESWRRLSERVRRAAPDLKRIDAVHVPDLEGHLEVWVPQLNYLEQWLPRFHEVQRNGAELWYYTAWVPQGRYPNRLLDMPLIKTRILHWMNHHANATGYLHWGYNFWDVPFYQFAPGDNNIVWPGRQGPRGGLRYQAMREGIEDHETLALLQDAAKDAARRLRVSGFDERAFMLRYLRLAVRSFDNYARDPAELYAARDAAARALVVLRGPGAPLLEARRTDGGDVVVEGSAPPGARVAVGAARARAGADGRVRLSVRAEGPLVEVAVRQGGRERRMPVPVAGP